MARQRVRLRGRFFLILLGLIVVIAVAIVLARSGGGSAEVRYGDVSASMPVSAVIVRDESAVSTEKYEKIIFSVVEGEAIQNGAQIAQVFKRGYQDESMITLLRLQREIYEQQRKLITADASVGLQDIESRIATVESQIRDSARGDSSLEDLFLELTE